MPKALQIVDKVNTLLETGKKSLVGTCVNSFDDEGDCTNHHLPWSTTSDFANAEENAKSISKDEFEKHATIPDSLVKKTKKHDVSYHATDDGVHMLYDKDTDVHHFFT